MDAQNFPVDDGGEGQEIEDLTAGFPDRGVSVFLLAFFVEAVDLGDLPGFVVAADEGYAVGVSIQRQSRQLPSIHNALSERKMVIA